MVRLSVEMITDAIQYINTVRDRELNLRGYKIPAIENLGITKNQFDTIDFTDNDIRKLDNLPLMTRLSTLLMHNNRIQQIQINVGEQLRGLKTLVLTNNNLCELGDLDPLATCTKLEYLSLIGNPVTHKPQYRLYTIYKLPTVRVLDFKRIRLAERAAADSLFKGKKGAELSKQVVKKSRPVEIEGPEPVNPSALGNSDAARIKEAIANAKTIAEVDHLQSLLASGRIPDKGWNEPGLPPPLAPSQGNGAARNAGMEMEEDE